jgi:site-specific recombinase XerD
MRKASARAERMPVRAATLYRDGLIIAFLALRPLRLRNLAGLELGRTLHDGPTGWLITIPAGETKTHRGIEISWPTDLVDALEIYLAHHRPVLARGSRATALWLGGAGQALADHTIRQTIIGRTQVVLGVSISPHLFRDCAATTLAIEDPAHIGVASTILGHARSSTTHKHYIQANTLAASRRHLTVLAVRRRTRASTDR